jgi:hypothetical protein
MSDRDRLAHDAQQEGDAERKHGEQIIAMWKDARERQESGQDPLLEALSRAHRVKAEETTSNDH